MGVTQKLKFERKGKGKRICDEKEKFFRTGVTQTQELTFVLKSTSITGK
jgi:hypothetical protein